MQLTVLKLIHAVSKGDLKPGAITNAMQMMVASNESFNFMVKGFPEAEQRLIDPCHMGIGRMDVTGDGYTGMRKSAIGAMKAYSNVP